MKTKNKYGLALMFAAIVCLQIVLFRPRAMAAAVDKQPASAQEQAVTIDFKLLEQSGQYISDGKSDLKEIPQDILALNGKTVKITGYFLVPEEVYFKNNPVSGFSVSRHAQPCPSCGGDPGTIFNTVVVNMKKGESVNPPFAPLVEVTGTFSVKKKQVPGDAGSKQLDSLFYINDARVNKTTLLKLGDN